MRIACFLTRPCTVIARSRDSELLGDSSASRPTKFQTEWNAEPTENKTPEGVRVNGRVRGAESTTEMLLMEFTPRATSKMFSTRRTPTKSNEGENRQDRNKTQRQAGVKRQSQLQEYDRTCSDVEVSAGLAPPPDVYVFQARNGQLYVQSRESNLQR
eukprot:gene18914-25471_t